jgi:hypothetical protein
MSASTAISCTVEVAALRSAPFNLDWGDNVKAKIVAINIYGDSIESILGGDAILVTTPGAPISVTEVYAERSKSTLALSWSQPAFTGGEALSNFRVKIVEQGGSYTLTVDLAAIQTSFKATGLTAGRTYEFRVQSQNSYGYSADSSVLSLLCAFIPDSPLTVATQNIDDKV